MVDYLIKLFIYFACFGVSMYALGALNYQKFIRRGGTLQAQLLFVIIAMCMALLLGDFLMNLLYYFR